MKRRAFLAAVSSGALLGTVEAANEPVPRIHFPKEPRARLAVASYPFRKDVDPRHGTIKLVDFPAMVIEKFQVRGIEPLDEHFPSTDATYLAEFHTALSKAGAHVVNIPVGRLHGSFYDPDSAKRGTAIANAKKWVDVAVALDAPGIRVHIQGVQGVTPNPEVAAEALKQVAAYGRRKNIVISLENDDPASEDAMFIAAILKDASTPWLRALPDFCNSMLNKKGEAYNDQALEALFPLAKTISHVKDRESDGPELYRVNLEKCFGIAKKSGYQGYFSMEWDSDGDPYAGTQHLIEASLKALA